VPETFGVQWLGLVGDEIKAAVLVSLRKRPAAAAELAQQLSGVAYDAARRRLRALEAGSFVEPDIPDEETSSNGSAGGVRRLTDRGLALASVRDVAAEWEAKFAPWTPATRTLGAEAARIAADVPTRAIGRALAHGALRVSELEPQLTDLSHAALISRLGELAERGLLIREAQGREVSYTLAEAGRRLVGVMVSAAWAEGAHVDLDTRGSDLAGAMHQLAPLARVSGVSGVCAIREHWHTTVQEDVYLSAGGGRLTALAVGPVGQPAARAEGNPVQWGMALIGDYAQALTIEGDGELAKAIVESIATVLRP
jgi:DNA-binding HxlR family transcriptional regulator